MKSITRRFIAQTLPIGTGRTITIDVNTGTDVSEAQAMNNALELARRKLGAKSIRVAQATPAVEAANYPADFSVGPKPESRASKGAIKDNAGRKDTPEKIAWAENEVARLLDHVTPDTAVKLILRQSDSLLGFYQVLVKLLDTVEATGGVIAYPDGTYAPQGEPDWIDLGDVIMNARDHLERLKDGPVTLTVSYTEEEINEQLNREDRNE